MRRRSAKYHRNEIVPSRLVSRGGTIIIRRCFDGYISNMTVTERCTTFRYYCLMRVYEWLGLTVTIHGSAITFAKLPTLKRVSCNIAKCSTPLRIGNAGLDIYPGCDAEQLRLLVELLRLC